MFQAPESRNPRKHLLNPKASNLLAFNPKPSVHYEKLRLKAIEREMAKSGARFRCRVEGVELGFWVLG